MAKVRRTKIIIEEVVGEDEGSTKVFVNGDQFKEIDFTDNKKDSNEEKKKATSTKKKTSSNKSSTSTKKKATSSKKKTTSSSKKKSTKSKNSSKKKATSTSKKKEENKKEVQETQSTASVIELPLKEEKKEVQVEEQVSSNTTKDSGFAEISVENEDKIIENAVPTPIEENGVSLLNQEENNKEVIDNPEVIDGEIKATNEVEIKGEEPETLEAEIIEKEEKDEEISASKENEKDSTKSESDASLEEHKSEETPKEENIEENKISESSEDKDEDNKDIKEDDVDQIEETKGESNEDTSKETETKEKNVSTTYTVVESNENDNKGESNKEEESKISKLFSTKGLIIGGVILVVLLAILIPVSLNLSNQSSNNHLIEISEEDINKNNFISSSVFFNNLESLELDIYDIRSTTTSLQTSLDYSFVNEIYSFELTNEIYYVNEETTESVIDKLTYNQNEDNYTFTTTVNGESVNVKDETKTYTKNQAKEMLQEVINDFYTNYLNCDGSSIKALIDDVTTKEESTLKYYYHDEANTYQIRDSSNSLLIVFDEYGIIESADYSHPGWCLQETPSEPGIKYYTLNSSYTLKAN